MNKKIKIIPLAILLLCAGLYSTSWTIKNKIKVPNGFKRMQYSKGSYSNWLQKLPLKKNKRIEVYDGSYIPDNYYNIFSVIKMPLLFKKDLEQCADYCMRFWVEYHRALKKLGKLYLFNYSGRKKYYKRSGKKLNRFVEHAMIYSNSYSLKAGCKKVKQKDVKPGDMIVQNEKGGIGHVSMVLDVCKNKKNQKLYLIGFSYMPAQEFHIEYAASGYGVRGWFSLKGYVKYLSEYYNYGKPVLRRF